MVPIVTEKFRRQLRQEAERWWSEGFIDASLYEKLSERYQFGNVEKDASDRFTAILMGLGGILLGLAAITFVAANWQEWSRTFKVILLLILFISVNVLGFHLWRRPTHQQGYQKLGQGLLLLGALILGANMALMSQMFHQSGNFYQLLLVWGLGVVAMAYSLRLTALGVLALLLIEMGYWSGWLEGASGHSPSALQLMVQHLPLVASLIFVPLAYWCRSRVIFGLAAIVITSSLIFNLNPLVDWWSNTSATPGRVVIAFTLPPALLWGYSNQIWQRFSATTRRSPQVIAQPPTDPFQPIARSLAIWFLGSLFYFFAFYWIWDVHASADRSSAVKLWGWLVSIDAIALGIVTGLGWLQIGRHLQRDRWFQEKSINSVTVAILLVLTGSIFFWHLQVQAIPEIATFVMNIMLFLLSIGLIRDGLALGNRNTFWGGMVLLVLGIVSRMLEYDTGLLLKAIVFALCGIGVIVAGLWFERNVTPHRPPSLPKSSQEELP